MGGELRGVTLGHNTAWRVWLWPYNGAGEPSHEPVPTSNVVHVDTTPPDASSAHVYDAADDLASQLDLDVRPQLTSAPLQVCCAWRDFVDAESPLASPAYEWTLSSDAAFASNVFEWAASEEARACASIALGTLQPLVTYRCAVRALNEAGLESAVVASDGFTYDATPPEGGWVSDGLTDGTDAQLLHQVRARARTCACA